MLPDLPNLKSELYEILRHFIHVGAHKRLGVFSECPKHIIHEGQSMRTIRADGTSDETNMQTASAEMTLQLSDIPTLTPQKRLEQLDKIAEEMARQMSQHLYENLEKKLDAAGRTISRAGKPLDAQAILEAFESMDMEFDESGAPSSLSISVAPNLVEAAHRAFEDISNDPDLSNRYKKILEHKRRDWRDREAARKLVG